MIGYPFDSMVTYDEHGNPSYDRAVSSKPLKTLISKLFTTGVMPNPSNNLQVFEGVEGMTVIVKAGFCVIEGGLKLEEEDRTLEIQAADTTYDRIDTVVMRWNNNDAIRLCDLYVVAGVPSANPTRPTLTREGSIYEIGLADVFVPKNSTVVAQYRITDTRMETERCGIVSSVSEFDTTTLYAQVQDDLAEFKTDEQAAFLAWFESIQDILDDHVAVQLQNEINALGNRVGTLENTQADWTQTDDTKLDYIKHKPTLGSAAALNVPTSGNAGSGQVVKGDDTRLSDARPASDVYSWAKQTSKPSYNASEITGGTFPGDVIAKANTSYGTAYVRNITATTTKPTAGAASPYPNGTLTVVYKT